MLLALSILACGRVKDVHDHDHDHEHELITRVVLSLTDSAGETTDYSWSDLEQDGTPSVDTMMLMNAETYQVAVSFWNDISDPIEEMTPEISDEAEEHMVVVMNEGLFDVTILDQDSNGADLGLEQEWNVVEVGESIATIGLRHLPTQDGNPTKPMTFTDEESLSGEWDVIVDFPVLVE